MLRAATPEAFVRDPELVWRWYHWRRQLVSDAEPNAGHRALAAELRSGVGEWELQAALEAVFRRRRGSTPAYPSIVASGANACVLHYSENGAGRGPANWFSWTQPRNSAATAPT